MKLLRTKIWRWSEIALLKWSALFVGLVVGAYFHEYVNRYSWAIIISALLLALRPAISYWKE
jgi:hypothetical protein